MSILIALQTAMVMALSAGSAACFALGAHAAGQHRIYRRTGRHAGTYAPDWTSWSVWLLLAVIFGLCAQALA